MKWTWKPRVYGTWSEWYTIFAFVPHHIDNTDMYVWLCRVERRKRWHWEPCWESPEWREYEHRLRRVNNEPNKELR